MTWAAPWCSPIEAATWLPNLLARVRMMPAQIETIANGMVSFSTAAAGPSAPTPSG